MRLIRTGKRFSIFGKLVLAFVAVISPLYLLGVYISDKGASIVDQEISKSLQQRQQFYLTLLETEVERMTALQLEFMNDEDLDALTVLNDRLSIYERLSAIKRLQSRLSMIKESSMYIANARVYIPSVERIVSSDGDVRVLDQARLDELKGEVLSPTHPFIRENDGLYIREYYPSPYNLNVRNPNFVLELELSLPMLYQFLEQLPGYEDGGAVLLYNDSVIASDRNAIAFNRIEGQINRELSKRTNEGTETANNEPTRITKIADVNEVYLATFLYSPILDCNLVVYVPEREVMGQLQHYRTYIWLITALAAFVVPLFAYWIYRIIHRPLLKLVGAFRKIEAGILNLAIRHKSNDEFRYLYEKFNLMTAHLNTLIHEVYEQKIRLQQSELKQLQSQINPHFLYNSFYLLYRMTKAYDMDNASRFTQFLGDYYQYMTRNAKEEVKLEEEIRHVRNYMEIQSIRFGTRVRCEMEELPESLRELSVPRLILQPIIENAYQHGFRSYREDCLLQVQYRLERSPSGTSLLSIKVTDNGDGMTDEQLEQWRRQFSTIQHDMEVTGLLNVHRRLQLKYGPEAGIRLEQEDAGLSVIVMIPIPTGGIG